MGLAKRMTDAKMVKNLRVVVMMEQVRGPKYTTVMKIKLCKNKEMPFVTLTGKNTTQTTISDEKPQHQSQQNLFQPLLTCT